MKMRLEIGILTQMSSSSFDRSWNLQDLSRNSPSKVSKWDVTPANNSASYRAHLCTTYPGGIFTNPTLIELRQEISQYHWLRGAMTSFSALARSVRQS
ncbi:hypothetical protein AVEN_38977-1 [Araneus ventricosus]|uniref:Uncharacterized protein n=1 Tax=Araneus ventricosus TaxID=182803 RepID=A0A4Y2KKS4_ARAVE|nr:hypothetical protein AVEN_38977-1 [Araneus ventricosus]